MGVDDVSVKREQVHRSTHSVPAYVEIAVNISQG